MDKTCNLLQPPTCKKPPICFICIANGADHESRIEKGSENFLRRCLMMRSVLVLAMILTGCGPMAGMMQNPGQPTAETVSTTEQSIDQAQLEAYNGPKARVAVYRFTDQTAKGGGTMRYPYFAWYTPQIGNGMAEMLNDALLQSNRFIVLDRQGIKDVLSEQDLAANGRVSRETAAPIGEVEGADLLIKGSITEFEPGSAGMHAGAGLGVFGLPGAILGGVLGGLRQSHVAMIIQVVDARTSRLLFSTTVEGKANDFDIGGALAGFGGGFGGVGGLGTWQKTPVEKAIRVAILQATKELSAKTPQTYFRHSTEAGNVSPTSAPNQHKPAVKLQSGSEKPRESTIVSEPAGKMPSILPSTVTLKVAAANLRESAGSQGHVVATLKEKAKLTVQAEDNGWYFVQTEDHKTGWIQKSFTVNVVY
jgi:curli biogenesis system outer membrane secretion channel CsgG